MNDLAIFIISCDKYSDIWNPFFKMFFKYWEDCPYTIYLCSDTLTYNHPKVIPLTPERDMEWSARLQWGLERCPHRYILFLQEDYIIYKMVDNKIIHYYLNLVNQTDAACLKLVPAPIPDKVFSEHPNIGVISKSRAYRVSTQAAIWKKEDLISLLDPTESVWAFEHNATNRALQTDYLFLSVFPAKNFVTRFTMSFPYHYYLTSVVAGKWKRIAVRICKENNVDVDLSKRPLESFWNMLYYDYAPLPVKHIMDFVANKFLKKKYWGYNS